MRHHEKSVPTRAAVLNCPAVLPFITMVFAWGTEKMTETTCRVKCFSVKKTFACRDGGEKSTETR